MENSLTVTTFLVLLMAVPRVEDMYADGPRLIQSEVRARAIARLSYTSLVRFVPAGTDDLRKGVSCINSALYGPDRPTARAFIQRLLVHDRWETPEQFEQRTTEVVWNLADRVAVLNRLLFVPSVNAPRIGPSHSYHHPWTVVSVQQLQRVDRQFPLLLDTRSITLDSLGKKFGGTFPGYEPLAEFDYYGKHYPRRKL